MKFRFLPLLALIVCSPVAVYGTTSEPPAAAVSETVHPFFRTDLYPAWSKMTAAQLHRDREAAMAETTARLAAIAAITPEQATFENTFLAFSEADENMRQLLGYVRHLSNMGVKPELQAATPPIPVDKTDRADTADKVKAVLLQAAKAPWVNELSPAKKLLIQRIAKSFERESGRDLQARADRIGELNRRIAAQSRQFVKNVEHGAGNWQLIITNSMELHGMSEKWMKHAAAAAEKAGHTGSWLVTAGTAHDVLRYCTVEATRRRCWYGTIATATAQAADNEPVIHSILEQRHELATLRGYKHYADMKTQGRMVRDAEHAMAIIDDLLNKSKPAWDAHVAAEMERFSKAAGQQLTTINPWDEAYFNTIEPPVHRGFDYGQLTPYLQAEKCISGMMNIWAGLLNLRFAELPVVCLKEGETCPEGHREVWHPSVRLFTVHDGTTGAHLGSFYLDLYPRAGKGGPAWCMPLRQGNPATADQPAEPHLAVLVANITPPPAEGKPHLLHHSDLYTIFHEFGHLMHHLLPHGELRSQGSMGVEQDFLEVPSQLQENWAWEPEALATFAFHHETGEPLPAELAAQVAADRRRSPLFMHMQMLRAAKLDLEFHMHYHEKFKGRPLDEVCAEILAPWEMPWSAPVPTIMRTMDYYINKGYDAGFYIYKWSEVLSAEAFTRFQKEGVMNPATGAAYRKAILDSGGSRPAAEQFHDFIGREPVTDSLMQRYQP